MKAGPPEPDAHTASPGHRGLYYDRGPFFLTTTGPIGILPVEMREGPRRGCDSRVVLAAGAEETKTRFVYRFEGRIQDLEEAMRRFIHYGLGCALLAFSSTASHADITFRFVESGSDVIMTSSGTFDTTGLSTVGPWTWGGVGIQTIENFNIMGGTNQGPGQVDITFAFNDGTDFSQWTLGTGPWTSSDFTTTVTSGTHGFATYMRDVNGVLFPGLGVELADMNGALWTPDQSWTWSNRTFASLFMTEGSFSVSDSVTGETITFLVVPGPASMALLGLGLGLGRTRRRRN